MSHAPQIATLLAEPVVARVTSGDLDTLAELDARGFLIGPDEALADYAKRLKEIRDNVLQLQVDLKTGPKQFFEFSLLAKDRIPLSVYRGDAESATRGLYDFSIDWVPGFYTNTSMGILYAGCALYAYEDFFAVFILRKSFQKKSRWLIYSRTELMAHELCHIARIGFRSQVYEEYFAYQTASSGFRRFIGGVLRSTRDTWLMLGSVLALLVIQIANVMSGSHTVWGFAIPLAAGAYLLGRYLLALRRVRQAQHNLASAFGQEAALPLLFRASDRDIAQLAPLAAPDELRKWIAERAKGSTRWQVNQRRYCQGED
jgi:hypothetical protein